MWPLAIEQVEHIGVGLKALLLLLPGRERLRGNLQDLRLDERQTRRNSGDKRAGAALHGLSGRVGTVGVFAHPGIREQLIETFLDLVAKLERMKECRGALAKLAL